MPRCSWLDSSRCNKSFRNLSEVRDGWSIGSQSHAATCRFISLTWPSKCPSQLATRNLRVASAPSQLVTQLSQFLKYLSFDPCMRVNFQTFPLCQSFPFIKFQTTFPMEKNGKHGNIAQLLEIAQFSPLLLGNMHLWWDWILGRGDSTQLCNFVP